MIRDAGPVIKASPLRVAITEATLGVVLAVISTLLGSAALAEPADSGNGRPDSRDVAPDSDRYFETRIAPLLARHCMDCHDSVRNDGGLDLTHKAAALAGGDSGSPIVSGKSDDSLLWQLVESDEMPQNQAPLSDDEKRILRRWIDAGATWSLDAIDPEGYSHDSRAAEVWLQRLTAAEYVATVRSSLGVDIEAEAARILPRDERADGFTNTSYNLAVDLDHVNAYARLAKMIVSRIDTAEFAAKYADCDRLSEECMRQLISRMGKQLLRGPLSDAEVDAYLGVTEAVKQADGELPEAVRYVIQAMLQSPRFIYRIERQRGDGSQFQADPYELASRMSYMIWGGPPDEQLMRAAEIGALHETQSLQSEVTRMLADPRAVGRSLQFIEEWLDLNRLETLRPNRKHFPHWNDQLAADMRDETLAFFEELAWEQRRPLWELLNAQFTYATPRLAHHYGLLSSSDPSGKKDDVDQTAARVTDGLQVLYTFEERGGDTVRDVSGAAEPLDLKITDPAAVRWQPGGLTIESSTMIARPETPTRLINALKKSNAITVEAWVTPADTVQTGPARIVTLSNSISSRNFTFGQAGDRLEARLRTTKTSTNGLPEVQSDRGSVTAAPMHVAFSRDASGNTAFYVDGREVGKSQVEGDFSKWDSKYRLALANEFSGDRPWHGTLHLVAVYDRALAIDDVRRNFAAGGGAHADELVALTVAASWERADKKNLLALYRFDEGLGDVVRDQSRAGEPLDLKVDNPKAVVWGEAGMTVSESTQIATAKPPKRLVEAIKKSKALTLEAWVTPANTVQDGPARILTLSGGTVQRNFTLGQDRDRFDGRIRADMTDANGLPSLSSPSGTAVTALTHLVYTKDAAGRGRLFVDGEEQASGDLGADLSKWDDGFRLAIANESSQDRPWKGTYHLIAIYDRALSPEEIRGRGAGMSRYDVADNPARGGLLTQASVLTIGGDEASMVIRGLFVLNDLLYSRVGNPPPCVDVTPVATKPGLSMRDQAEARLADSSCVGCHARFEPLAFGLEKFDGIGGHHETDPHGNRLREDGEIHFPGKPEPVSYQTSAELMDLLAESERVQMAITRKVAQFALGRPLIAADLPELQKIHATARENGGSYQALMSALVLSDLVRFTRPEGD